MTRDAFSLIEVSLAVLLIGIGLLSLFSLFPLALKESDLAIVETQEAMFADHILSGIEANAQAITDFLVWTNPASFFSDVRSGIYPLDLRGLEVLVDGVEFPRTPLGTGRVLRYRLAITPSGSRGGGKSVKLEVRSGKYDDFAEARVYSTRLVYLGM